jgi:alkylation response protein AidB-like acyl-CoA dehydrogenase
VFVATEAADSALEASWFSHLDVSVPAAALLAAQAAGLAVKHGLQVCGGMGFSDEFSYADQIRRAVLLADLFWSESELAQRVGARVAAEKIMPRLQSAVQQR